jgi:DNA-binding response OmpR family regulator
MSDTAETPPPPPPRAVILLVEDDDKTRMAMRIRLERDGYQILEARNGEEALSLFGQYSGPLDLLVTDLAMPRMGGRELATHLSSRFPALRILYISGYTAEESESVGMLPPGVPFLQKPFGVEVVVKKVNEMLATPGGPGPPPGA